MNITATKLLIPATKVAPVFKTLEQDAVCLDLYPKRYQNEVVFTVRKPEESDGKYGPGRKKSLPAKTPQFVDFYI